ncbi:PIR protein [Plasmodium ovale]|uniref:PIR Superfamily Protein n=2 Tax=Plasmodium ovale TaxID=36330 RepID=A0A1A8XCB6_PLAOA|nr:PIR Superfamily Protein [Plasmodium ovale curtisi]SBT83347.1 PIR protein [Plasmodium ovale]
MIQVSYSRSEPPSIKEKCTETYADIVSEVGTKIADFEKMEKDENYVSKCLNVRSYLDEKGKTYAECFGEKSFLGYKDIYVMMRVHLPEYTKYKECRLELTPHTKESVHIQIEQEPACTGESCSSTITQVVKETEIPEDCIDESCSNPSSEIVELQDLSTDYVYESEESEETDEQSNQSVQHGNDFVSDILSMSQSVVDAFVGDNSGTNGKDTYLSDSSDSSEMYPQTEAATHENELNLFQKLLTDIVQLFTFTLNPFASSGSSDNSHVTDGQIISREGSFLGRFPFFGHYLSTQDKLFDGRNSFSPNRNSHEGTLSQGHESHFEKLQSSRKLDNEHYPITSTNMHDSSRSLGHNSGKDIRNGITIINRVVNPNGETVPRDTSFNVDPADQNTLTTGNQEKTTNVSVTLFLIILALTMITAILIKFTSLGDIFDKKEEKKEEENEELDRILNQPSLPTSDSSIYLSYSSLLKE